MSLPEHVHGRNPRRPRRGPFPAVIKGTVDVDATAVDVTQAIDQLAAQVARLVDAVEAAATAVGDAIHRYTP